MKAVMIYSADYCPYCVRAKQFFESRGIAYTELRVDENDELRAEMEAKSGRRTIPQIFIGESHVGGYDDLIAMARSGSLDTLLEE